MRGLLRPAAAPGVVAGAIYWALFGWLHPLLFDRLYPWLVADLTVERTAFAYRAALYAVFGIALVLVNVVVDYAKIRLVVEDRLSAVGALSAALRFIRRQPGAVLGLYLLNAIVFLVILGIYGLSARVATSGVAAVLALALGQVYIVLRVIARLTFAASQIALFQSRLAHAGYTARAAAGVAGFGGRGGGSARTRFLSSDVPECRSSRTQELRNLGTQELRLS